MLFLYEKPTFSEHPVGGHFLDHFPPEKCPSTHSAINVRKTGQSIVGYRTVNAVPNATASHLDSTYIHISSGSRHSSKY